PGREGSGVGDGRAGRKAGPRRLNAKSVRYGDRRRDPSALTICSVSSGAYALIGVLVGGLLTAATQIGIGLFMSRRTERAEWKIASRLVTEELERLMNDLRLIIEGGATPSVPTDERFLSSAFWDEHHTV